MSFSLKRTWLIALAGAGVILGGCAGNVEKEKPVESATKINNDDYYEAYHEGRLYVFDDAATYLEFLEMGETPYRKVRIGEGPHGETVVFGLTSSDKKKSEGIASIDMYDGRLKAAEDFYGEIYKDGRIYVFSRWEDLQAVRTLGHPSYMYTDIGAGPNGETVVYVLNGSNKKQKPVKLMQRYRALRVQG